jgi:hypothetical protein
MVRGFFYGVLCEPLTSQRREACPRGGGRFIPHKYLLRQFQWIRDGKCRNANAEMVAQIQEFGVRELKAVLDYNSRLLPSEELCAPADWKNPDFK